MEGLRQDKLTPRERAVQRKIERGQNPSERDKRVMQAKLERLVQARGMDFPPNAQVIAGGSSDSGAVLDKMHQMAAGMWKYPPNFAALPIASVITQNMNNFQVKSLPIAPFTQTEGPNTVWSGTIRFAIENKQEVTSGTGQSTTGAGGTGGLQVGASQSTTDTGGVTGSATGGSQSGPETGRSSSSGTVGVSGSTATTTGSSQQTTVGGTSTVGQQTQDTLVRSQATVIANITLHCELEVSGSDYINPFKWGMMLGEAISPISDTNDAVACGTVMLQESRGFAPAPPPAGH